MNIFYISFKAMLGYALSADLAISNLIASANLSMKK